MLKKECVGLDCAWFTKVEGYDMNTGNRVDEWNCAMSWLPMLLIENSGMQRQTGAAVESFRNEMVKANESTQQILLAAASGNVDNMKTLTVVSETKQITDTESKE